MRKKGRRSTNDVSFGFEFFSSFGREPCFPTVLSIEMKNGIDDFMGPVFFNDCHPFNSSLCPCFLFPILGKRHPSRVLIPPAPSQGGNKKVNKK